ncbi:MAG: NYN domain-containing protein [Acidobacteriota bacterium]|jgi:hypothetical protein
MNGKPSYLRSALFVDFDNIYLGLGQGGGGGEDEFARNPARWLRWLEESLESALPVGSAPSVGEAAPAPLRRRILVRRCYLNPQSFHRSRPFFIRAGFEVVDTPALTAQGKTSADVQMALDMVDTLNHTTRFDEFVLFSGDADFTPVLRRLREHDRRTVVLATGPTAAAYRSVCDLVIDEERFVEEALGITGEETAARPLPAGEESASPELLRRIGARVRELAAMTGGVQPVHLPGIYKEFREFAEGENWLGYYSLRAMTEAVVEHTEGLTLVGEDPWWVGLEEEGEEAEAAAVIEGPRAAPSEVGIGGDERLKLERFVLDTVARADRPLSLATMAHLLIEEFGDDLRAFNWRGAGSFKGFLERLDLDPIRISEADTGYIFDPERHDDPAEHEARDQFADERPELARFAESVHELTDTPYLSPERYAVVLDEMAKEIGDSGFHMTRTSKAVRDRCYGKGIMVPRAAISFLLKGLSYSGYPLHEGGPHTVWDLGEAVAENTVTLCRRAQMEPTAEQEDWIREWILGGLPEPDSEPDSAGGEREG